MLLKVANGGGGEVEGGEFGAKTIKCLVSHPFSLFTPLLTTGQNNIQFIEQKESK